MTSLPNRTSSLVLLYFVWKIKYNILDHVKCRQCIKSSRDIWTQILVLFIAILSFLEFTMPKMNTFTKICFYHSCYKSNTAFKQWKIECCYIYIAQCAIFPPNYGCLSVVSLDETNHCQHKTAIPTIWYPAYNRIPGSVGSCNKHKDK